MRNNLSAESEARKAIERHLESLVDKKADEVWTRGSKPNPNHYHDSIPNLHNLSSNPNLRPITQP